VYKVFGFDPFFNINFLKKYLIENNLNELNFEHVSELNDELLKKVSCICIVQHHDQTKEKINKIYKKSMIPLIYDCQNKIKEDINSKTILEHVG